MTRSISLSLLLAIACGDDATPMVDAGTDSSTVDAGADSAVDSGVDASAEEDSGMDAGDGCIRATAGTWTLVGADDVSVSYDANITPAVDTGTRLALLFERYMPGPDVGTFTLGEGRDDNFGSCAHCVHIPISPTRVYFADRGTLETRVDPYSQRMDATLSNVRLVEAEVDPFTRESTPIEGGGCVELEDVTIVGSFPPEGWACDDEDWADGVACHCECGGFDPDCNVGSECPPFDPGCVPTEPLPIANCLPGDICGFDPVSMLSRCTSVCDWEGRDGCSSGTCVFDFGLGDTCFPPGDERIDSAGIGGTCAAGALQKVCNVMDGFANGWCDDTSGNLCRPLCTSDGECTTVGETCRRFVGLDGLGYCGPEPGDG